MADSRWSDLRLRVLSAAVLAPIALACIWYGDGAFTVLLMVVAAGLGHEWRGLCGDRAVGGLVLFLALPAAVLVAATIGAGTALLLLMAATGIGAAVAGGFSRRRPLAFGLPYLGIGAVSLIWLRQTPSGLTDVIVLLPIIWASDSGAYLAGRAIGGKRLAPSLSPGKTWSGAMGGLVAAAAVGMAASAVINGGPVSPRAIGLALLIGVVAQAGDLFESGVKRHFGVKDSGHLIPGHGGLLDRLDAVLTAAPTAALLLVILGHGVSLWK